MDSQPNKPGFPTHLVQQLEQASQQVSQNDNAHAQTSRGAQRGGVRRSTNRGGTNRGQSFNSRYSQNPGHMNAPNASQNPSLNQQSAYSQNSFSSRANSHVSTAMTNHIGHQPSSAALHAGSEEDFPTLGSTRSNKSSRSSSSAPPQPAGLPIMNHERAQTFQQRARDGFYRGRNSSAYQNAQGMHQQQRVVQPPQYHVQQFQMDDFRRPSPQHQGVYNPMAASMANQRHTVRKRIIVQNEYLESVADSALTNQMPVEEQHEKEALRQTLERIMHQVISDYGMRQPTIDATKVKLKCYGSLASGFAVAGSDMDLLVTFPRDGEPTGNLEEDIKRLFEKALLDAGFGARLLTQTRVPIMRICEKPTLEILDGLRRYRAKWEQDEQDAADLEAGRLGSNRLPVVTNEEIEAASEMFAQLGNEPSEISLPPSPGRELPHLEYTKDCGIQCDINFSNYVALQNTRLLRTYCLLDERVRRMGLIVKIWAKARKINTPYRGTLSSYGYILMLLHFLMNIASPPVIPNLQIMAKDQDAWSNKTDFDTVDGFDVRFIGDREQISAAMEGRPRNQETLGGLLRGFFWYYSDQQGFHWTNDIISIRSPGGCLTKRSKGWTEAKWTGVKNTIRNRYLLCIEDPFETEHNIARTVCHSGIVAIRDEFRRARKILERVEKVSNVGWQWLEDNGEPGQEFLSAAEDRGDLLKKDHDFHKLKRLRAEAEATERALKEANALVDLEAGSADDGSKQNGTSSQNSLYNYDPLEAEPPNRKLTRSVGHQQEEVSPQNRRLRQVKLDSDDEEDDSLPDNHVGPGEAGKDVPDSSSLFRSMNVASSQAQEQHGSEPDCFDGIDFVPRTVDTFGKLLPWDRGTQEGRWLHWRDRKVKNGSFTGVLSPGLRTLNEQCPFDPSRPHSISSARSTNQILGRPPFPMCKAADGSDWLEDESSSVANYSTKSCEFPLESSGWDATIAGGTWLNKRDEYIRAGTFLPPHDPYIRSLHDTFPYMANISPASQVKRNLMLKLWDLERLMADIPKCVHDMLANFPVWTEPNREEQDSQNRTVKSESGNGAVNDIECNQSTVAKKPSRAKRKSTPRIEREEPEALLVSLSEDHLTSNMETTDQPWMKIRWDKSTRDGRWLIWRDKHIQGASKRALKGRFRRLDAMFPYIENPSLEVQAERNARLLAMQREVRSDTPPDSSQKTTEEHPMQSLEKSSASPSVTVIPQDSAAQECSSLIQEPLLSKMSWEDTLLGSWFSWRDNKMRRGEWKPKRTSRGEKGQMFMEWMETILPFISRPTPAQQAQLNEQLRKITSEHAQLAEFEGLQSTSVRPSVRDMADLLSLCEKEIEPQNGVAWNATTGPLLTKSRSAKHSVAPSEQDFVRDQRLNYFTSESATTQDARSENQNPNTIQGQARKTGQSLTVSSSASHKPTIATTSTEATTATNSAAKNGKTDINAQAIVPQSLHEGSTDECLRDEDPTIMPIPSQPAFEFDERQLRDLNIIKQGGNGCARFGEEWNIESDREWGGGGWMGHKKSDNQDLDTQEAEKWEGKGDDQGLLAFLPGL
jgi:terminal uridylyltransferase